MNNHFIAMKIKSEIVSDDENCDHNNNKSDFGKEEHNSRSLENKTTTAKKLLSIIKKGDFDELVLMLSEKPDLNVFINGQTALHHCLLLGKLSSMTDSAFFSPFHPRYDAIFQLCI